MNRITYAHIGHRGGDESWMMVLVQICPGGAATLVGPLSHYFYIYIYISVCGCRSKAGMKWCKLSRQRSLIMFQDKFEYKISLTERYQKYLNKFGLLISCPMRKGKCPFAQTRHRTNSEELQQMLEKWPAFRFTPTKVEAIHTHFFSPSLTLLIIFPFKGVVFSPNQCQGQARQTPCHTYQFRI